MEVKRIQILFLGMVYLSTKVIDSNAVSTFNEYVDNILQNLRENQEIAKHINPLKVPDIHQDSYVVTNMKIFGLLSLYRYGDCSLTINGEKVDVVAKVAVKDVEITLDYSAKALFFWITGKAEIEVKHLLVKLDFSNTNGYVKLNSFKVMYLNDYKVRKMTGVGKAFNWLLQFIANATAQFSKKRIICTLETEAAKAIEDQLKKYNLPV